MARQMFIHEIIASPTALTEKQSSKIKFLNWNIRNPSIKRAKEQSEWILQTNADVIILTEAKYSEGSRFIQDWLESHAFDVFLPQPPNNNDYCVMIATKRLISKRLELSVNFLPCRAVSIVSEIFLEKIRIIGLYVPSRGSVERRNVDKRKFQYQIIDLLRLLADEFQSSGFVICGDLNVLERNHIPHYSVFGEWEYEFYESFIKAGLVDAYRLVNPSTKEYSWFGKKGNGYRFDHFFVSTILSQSIVDCSYIHTPRSLKLSDHSAMYLEIDFSPQAEP